MMPHRDHPNRVALTGEFVRGLKRRLVDLQAAGDPEAAHGEADDVLCELLTVLGYKDIVAEWQLVQKWYA